MHRKFKKDFFRLSLSFLVQLLAAEKSERDLIKINVVSEQQDSLYHFLSNHQMQRNHLIKINVVSEQQDSLMLDTHRLVNSQGRVNPSPVLYT